MATSIIFYGSEISQTNDCKSEVFRNAHNEIYISIERPYYPGSFISLDVETAIKFSKELRKSIAEAKEGGNV